MKKQNLFAAVLVAFGLILSSPAMAAASFSIAGAGSYGLKKLNMTVPLVGTAEIKGGLGFGGGAFVNFGVAANSIEIGALYLSRKMESVAGGVTTSTTSGAIHIPVMYRFGKMLSLGLGGFYDLALETGDESNYGLTAGPRVTLPGGLFFDARYNHGLNSDVMDGSQEILFLVGFKFK